MKNEIDFKVIKAVPGNEIKHHAKCRLLFDAYNGDYDCEYRIAWVKSMLVSYLAKGD